MRSLAKSHLVRLALIGLALIVAACADKAGGKDERANGARLASEAGPVLPRQSPAASGRDQIPILDEQHFNLHCTTRAHVVSDSHPELQTGTYPIGLRSWDSGGDWVVDLQTMRFCVAPDECLHHSPRAIPRLTEDRITLVEDPGVSTSVRRRDLRFQQRTEDGGRVTVESGRCVKQPFSGFPAVPRPV